MKLQTLLTAVAWISVGCANSPRSKASTAPTPGHVYVVNTEDDSVSFVDLQAMREVSRHHVGKSPYGIALSADGKTAAVGVEGEQRIKFFSLPGFQPIGEHEVGAMHHDHMLRSPDGRSVVLANYHSDSVIGIDFATMRESYRIPGVSGPHAAKIGPRTGYVYVTCKKITGIAAIDTTAKKLVQFHPLRVNPRGLSFFADEAHIYFGSFWVDGFFEYDVAQQEISRKFTFPRDGDAPREVTYHGVEAMNPHTMIAANEGRSFLDVIDRSTGALLDRLDAVANPCCLATIPGTDPPRVLVSNIGDSTVQVVELTADRKLVSLGRVAVGAGPKRVAFVPRR